MIRIHRFVPLMLAALLVLALFRSGAIGFAEPAERDGEEALPPFGQLKRGMSPQEVRQLVGAPKHIARQIFYHHYREQWLYDAAVPVRLTFDCPRGQKPQLLDNTEPRP